MKPFLLDRWTWGMAWRESRSSRKRLLLFISSITLGVAALVAIQSLGESLEREVNQQSKSLLGADLVITRQEPFAQETEELFETWGGEQSRETRFSSMVYFPETGGTRLVQIRAIEGDFPYYGELQTSPRQAAQSFREGPYALVDERLMLQYHVSAGDPVKIGDFTFTVAGALQKIPGETMTETFISPRVYIPLSYLDQTDLIQFGGRVSYRNSFKFDPAVDVEQLLERERPHLREYRLRTTTVEERRARLGRTVENVYRFLSLVGFIALLLGGIGVASAIHIYIKQKLATVATLRCLGASSRQATSIYVIQAVGMGFIGASVGALLGIAVRDLLPRILQDFLPLTIPFEVSWIAILQGIGMGLTIGLLFALLPLLPLRRISPLLALRVSYEEKETLPREPLQWLIYTAIGIAICLFAIAQTRRLIHGLAFAGAIVLVFLLLTAVAKLITILVRRYCPESWPYVWRQGLANLHRPNNQTIVVMLSLGLGTFLITTLYLVQGTLLQEVSLAGSGEQPNLVLFDIQSDQREEIIQLVSSLDLPVEQSVAIVTMRLASVKGRAVEEIAENRDSSVRRWPLFREFRATYRESLIDSEELISGTWQARVEDPSDLVLISLEEDMARDLNVSLGDKLVFDVQGVPIETTLGNTRRVDWRRFQTNFLLVFPAGVLEEAPQFHVLMTRADSPEASAELQRMVVERFPNVSTIDLALVLDTVDTVLSQVSVVIRSMALFSILTGLIVLVGAVVSSRYQRTRESVLLRTLGASRDQITKILAVEYFSLGLLAALTGLTLSIASSWALAFFVFETEFVVELVPLLVALVVVVGLTLLIGIINSRGMCDRSPLEVLRAEG
ncbi:MAG: ABC transporter permease [Acidobacteria bacterium]|nr:ABC transporter permease [Acidobacteriota bacterium]